MSATQSTETYQCQWCDGDREPHTSVKGSFCSTACHREHKADKKAKAILDQFHHQHIRCGTCFRKLKEIEKPKPHFEFVFRDHGYVPDGPNVDDGQTMEFIDQEESRQAAVGFEYSTEHAVGTDKTIRLDEHGREAIIGTGVGCQCGTTAHNQVAEELRSRFRIEYTYHLSEAIHELRDAEKLADMPPVDHETLFEHAIQGADFRDALREAIQIDADS